MPTLDRSFFDTTTFFKLCASSQDPLLENLSLQLEEAWSALIANDEAESLMCEVNDLVNYFETRGGYPPLDEVKISLLRANSDYFRQAVKWASVYAGLAAIAARHANISDARQLIASSALVLFRSYQPRSADAFNSYFFRKGGAARSAQRRPLKDELYSLIEQEIRAHRKPFDSRIEAAAYFAVQLNEAAKRLGIKNSSQSMSNTIRTWLSSDEQLKALIKNLISPNPRRKRS